MKVIVSEAHCSTDSDNTACLRDKAEEMQVHKYSLQLEIWTGNN